MKYSNPATAKKVQMRKLGHVYREVKQLSFELGLLLGTLIVFFIFFLILFSQT